jgi:hypothetical protein
MVILPNMTPALIFLMSMLTSSLPTSELTSRPDTISEMEGRPGGLRRSTGGISGAGGTLISCTAGGGMDSCGAGPGCPDTKAQWIEGGV